MLTPSYAAYLAEREPRSRPRVERASACSSRASRAAASRRFRARLEEGWGAKVTEAMGIGDIGVSLWGECEEQDGMHLGARGFVHAELIDPATAEPLALEDGATGELVLTHLRHRAAPLLRFRTRDHVAVRTGPCPCGRTGPRDPVHRPDRRHADRPRRQRVPFGGPRGRGRVRAGRSAATSWSSRRAGREAGAAASGRGRARRRSPPPTRRSRKRSVRGSATCSSSRHGSSSCPGERCGGASTSHTSCSDEEAPEPGCPPKNPQLTRRVIWPSTR